MVGITIFATDAAGTITRAIGSARCTTNQVREILMEERINDDTDAFDLDSVPNAITVYSVRENIAVRYSGAHEVMEAILETLEEFERALHDLTDGESMDDLLEIFLGRMHEQTHGRARITTDTPLGCAGRA